ncbi:MAG: efflux RND transporter periplasmic adaptor subunit [Terracidiphilus sp.]|nr:efflux RND transporter periplasmic adaptor subunit [Terracidiphilus sp.]
MKTRRILLAALAVTIVPLPGCKKEAPPETQVTVQAEHPEQGPVTEHFTADAVLAPLAQAAIAPKIGAPVRKFYVQRGARVKEGELLATLENSDLAAAALDNKGSYMAAEAAYATATKAQVPEDTQKAELDVALAKANLDLNLSIVKSRKQLFAEGAIPGRDLDTANAALVQAQAAFDSATKHLESVRSVSRAAALKAAEGQLTSAEGKYKGAQAQQSYSEIRSPIDGVVTDRPLFAGETAAAGAPLITVMDTSSLLAKTHIAESVAQRMKVGDDASVQVPGVADPVAAKVELISPALDPGSTTVEIWLKIGNKAGSLKVGTPVKVSITGRTVAQAWKVPASAILTAQDGSKFVMVVGSDGAAHRKPVVVGILDGDDIQVASGLAPGDLVVTGGAYGLDDGTKVKVGAPAEDDKAPAAAKDGGNG